MTTLAVWLSLPPGTIVQVAGGRRVVKLDDYSDFTDYECVTVHPDGGRLFHITEFIDFNAEFIGQFAWET